MEVHHVTEDAETFTCNAFLVVGEETTLVDAGSWDASSTPLPPTPTTSIPSS